MTAVRAWIYPTLVIIFVAFIIGILHLGDRRFGGTLGVWPAVSVPSAGGPAAEGVASHGAPPAAPPSPAAKGGDTPWQLWRNHAREPLARLLLQLVIIVAAARLFGAVARALRQPSVIGEIAAGIALGPSLVGMWFPQLSAAIFPASSLGLLQLLAQIGVIFFMFVVGLELDWASVRKRAHAAVAVSHVSILLPFLLGVIAAFPLYREHAPAGVPFQAFGLFMGIAMSITAFPVLARILEERGLTKTPIGATALTCAAIDDVTAWALLAFVVAVVTTGGALSILGATIAVALLFGIVMTGVVRPALARALAPRLDRDQYSKERVGLVLAVVCAAALTTEVIGLHALFGAFVAGAILPPDEDFRRGLRERLETFSAVFLLPVFFVVTGLRTQIGLLDDRGAWLTCVGIILLATAGKFAGSALTARVMGIDWNSSFILGALMNTRGLMELIALNVGYDLGVISAEMFTSLVLMALVTTALTGPMVDLALAWPSTRVTVGSGLRASEGAGGDC
jgi:Kef-type K+ transport system membrane component KefB